MLRRLAQLVTPLRAPLARGCLAWATIAAVLVAMYGPTLVRHVQASASPLVFNDDVRQHISPFYRFLDSSLLHGDYLGDYYLACLPWGYRGLYTLVALLGVDPALFSKVLTYALHGVTVVALGLAARAIDGRAAAWAAMAVALGSGLYLDRIAGGLPRSFAFPLMACTLAAVAGGKVRLTAGLVLLAAAFYPPAGAVAGLTLAALLLGLPRVDRGEAEGWSLRKRILVLSGTAAAAVLILLPFKLTSHSYGKVIRPADVTSYPEAGPGGRYIAEDRPPFEGFFKTASLLVGPALLGAGEPWSAEARGLVEEPGTGVFRGDGRGIVAYALFVLVLAGSVGLLAVSGPARRIAALLFAAFVGHYLSRPLAPHFYLPQRYVIYTVPLVATIAISTWVVGLMEPWPRRTWPGWIRAAVVAACGILMLLVLGGRGNPRAGLTVDMEYRRSFFEAVAALPPSALVAGWPVGLIDTVPYASRRKAFVTYESHQAFHVGFVLEMRRRMRALIDAYFAASPELLARLRDEFGVTHLLVDLDHYGERPPRYFRPFDEWTRDAIRAAQGKPSEILRQIDRAAVYREGSHIILDLSRVASNPPRKP